MARKLLLSIGFQQVLCATVTVVALGGCGPASEAAAPTLDASSGPGPAGDAGVSGDVATSPLPSVSNGDASMLPDVQPARKGKTVFVAAGHMGRTMMSCDGGLTWIHDRSDRDEARCWVSGDPNYVECDHTPYSSPAGGLVYGDGRFYSASGWGFDGSVRRTTDGASWDTVKTGGWGGGVAYAKHTLLVVWEGAWSTSTDSGSTWNPVPSTDSNGFDHALPRGVGDRFFVIGRDGGAATLALSSDGGGSWTRPSGLGRSNGVSLVEGNGVVVGTGETGMVARSVNGGQTWSSKQVLPAAAGWATRLVFDGSAFVALSGGSRWTSTDGEAWTSTPFTIDGAAAPPWWSAAFAVDPETRTFVAVLSVWGNYYDKQRAYRSADGIAWTTLDDQHFKGGHPLSQIVSGRLDAPACP